MFSFLWLIFTQLFLFQKKAVSTSHCSQPNTIEYELALDWMLLREKQEKKFRILHKVDTIVLNICMRDFLASLIQTLIGMFNLFVEA